MVWADWLGTAAAPDLHRPGKNLVGHEKSGRRTRRALHAWRTVYFTSITHIRNTWVLVTFHCPHLALGLFQTRSPLKPLLQGLATFAPRPHSAQFLTLNTLHDIQYRKVVLCGLL